MVDEVEGWVMVNKRLGVIVAGSFSILRRDAIEYLEDLYRHKGRRWVLRRFKPVKAFRIIEVKNA